MHSDVVQPTLLEGLRTAAAALGIDRLTCEDVIRGGLLGEVFKVDGRLAVRAGAAQNLANSWPEFDPRDPTLPPALVVKVRAARPEDDGDRAWIGWHADLAPRERADGVRGWWTVRDVDQWTGGLLVATIGGIVVETWRITGHQTIGGKLQRFEVKPPPPGDVEAARYKEHRMPPSPGGVTLRLPMV